MFSGRPAACRSGRSVSRACSRAACRNPAGYALGARMADVAAHARARRSQAPRERFPLTTRASPLRRSAVIGCAWLHCRAAFLPGAENLLHFEDLIRCRCRSSVAQRSTLERDERESRENSACRSRWMIWVESFAGWSPIFSQTGARLRGSRCACVPTHHSVLPTPTRASVCERRSSARPNRRTSTRVFSPKVIGSA